MNDPAADPTPITPAPTGEAAPAAETTPAVAAPVEPAAPATPVYRELSIDEVARIPKPSVGRIVFFALPVKTYDGNSAIETRPAIITRVWERTDGRMPMVQLAVFRDGSNDRCDDRPLPKRPTAIDPELEAYLLELEWKVLGSARLVAWATSASYSAEGAANSWRWMPFQLGQAAKTAEAEAKAAAPAVGGLEQLYGQIAGLRSALIDLGERSGHKVSLDS